VASAPCRRGLPQVAHELIRIKLINGLVVVLLLLLLRHVLPLLLVVVVAICQHRGRLSRRARLLLWRCVLLPPQLLRLLAQQAQALLQLRGQLIQLPPLLRPLHAQHIKALPQLLLVAGGARGGLRGSGRCPGRNAWHHVLPLEEAVRRRHLCDGGRDGKGALIGARVNMQAGATQPAATVRQPLVCPPHARARDTHLWVVQPPGLVQLLHHLQRTAAQRLRQRPRPGQRLVGPVPDRELHKGHKLLAQQPPEGARAAEQQRTQLQRQLARLRGACAGNSAGCRASHGA
jgi:hypothetical protein